VDLVSVASAIQSFALPAQWRSVNCVENHDIVYKIKATAFRILPTKPTRAVGTPAAVPGWRQACCSPPGHPMLFFGQEILEDKQWSDYAPDGLAPYWEGLHKGDTSMINHLRFTLSGFITAAPSSLAQ